jgi:hypothetical protein
MTKVVLIILFSFLFSISIPIQAQESSIDIVLIDKRDTGKNDVPPLPEKLIIGVTTNSDWFFKLTTESGVVEAGALKNGMNMISIPAAPLFEKPGFRSFNYVLEIKAGDKILQKIITLDVSVKFDSPAPSDEAKAMQDPGKTRYYEISMFIGDRYIDSFIKPVDPLQVLKSFEKKKLPPPLEFDPIHPSQPAQSKASVSPLMLAGMAYNVIDKKIKKNKAEKLKEMRERTRSINGVFRKTDEKGNGIPVDLSIKLTVHD